MNLFRRSLIFILCIVLNGCNGISESGIKNSSEELPTISECAVKIIVNETPEIQKKLHKYLLDNLVTFENGLLVSYISPREDKFGIDDFYFVFSEKCDQKFDMSEKFFEVFLKKGFKHDLSYQISSKHVSSPFNGLGMKGSEWSDY